MTFPSSPPRRSSRSALCQGLWCALLLAVASTPAAALETVVHEVDRRIATHVGEAVLEDSAGGVMLRTADDQLHLIPAARVRSRTSDDRPLEMLDAKQLGEKLLAELPPGFHVHYSKNYVVCYNTTTTYAEWCSSLLERLQRAFVAHWDRRGSKIAAPEHPLPVVIFSNQAGYANFAKADLGPAVANVIGYYSMASNRIVMYDLTGAQAVVRNAGNRGSLHDISALLSQPAAAPLVATIVHEATHQISFNSGLQTRYGENPLWMSEGLAMYFETPDLSSSRSWSGVGEVNYSRWDRYLDNEAEGRLLGFQQLVGSDDAFRIPKSAVDAYAQAWALNYFLIRWRPQQYVEYLTALAAMPPLHRSKPEQRLAEFKTHFGDLPTLQREFERQMRRIR